MHAMPEKKKHHGVIWLASGIIAILATVAAFCPAQWMAALVERQTAGRVSLGDAQGTLWQGSAFIGGAAGRNDPVTPLLPGRFQWELSPLLLLGRVDLRLTNAQALSAPVQVSGGLSQWQLTPGSVELPAERLAGLGAPLNTIKPQGRLRLSWNTLQAQREENGVALVGSMHLEMRDIASRLSAIKPLGSYDLTMDWQGRQAQLSLRTLKGPLLLQGSGALVNGRLQFSGKAEAENGNEERLANLLNLLGQRRTEGNKNIIALEFK